MQEEMDLGQIHLNFGEKCMSNGESNMLAQRDSKKVRPGITLVRKSHFSNFCMFFYNKTGLGFKKKAYDVKISLTLDR